MGLRGWTTSVREAWQWAKSAVRRGLDVITGYTQYTAGGGEIDPAAWQRTYELGERLYAQGRLIQDLPAGAIIIEDYFTPVDTDYGGTFHLSAEMYYFNKGTQEWETKFVSTNLDELASREDWEEAIVKAVKDTELSPDIDWKQGYDLFNFIAERRM